MMLTATLIGMNEAGRRKLAGAIVSAEIARRHMTGASAAKAWHIARSTLSKVQSGDSSVHPFTLRGIEGGLDLPHLFLDHVITGDVARIKRQVGLREDLRQYAVESLEDAGQPLRRAADN